MQLIVIDASVVASWFLPDENAGKYSELFNHLDRLQIMVPVIFEYEILNIVLIARKRGRISPTIQKDIVNKLKELPIDVEDCTNDGSYSAYELANTYSLTVYDASYLELANRLKLPLLTYDKEMLRVIKQLGITTTIQG